ncbi:DNA-directed RNA polymerase subunit omega [Limisalsivibrio acetivorans]|uniref:DNA-directed RNA polymerase subunit omega n=1 Tax=Limisalsivibrio acetivorans TaxID=1304888 RepID=UPI0003B769FB|nr:DNA-directed RNA polymerase subunit omega [Limisalsivibrio acetivorans]
MPMLDIEKIIRKPHVRSRFRLVHMAGVRAKELNDARENTLDAQLGDHYKVTTTALDELIREKVAFRQIEEENE